MHFKLLITGIVFHLISVSVTAQDNQRPGYMPWHRLDTIRLDYLVIDKAKDSSVTCELDFLIKISGAAFTRKHTNLAKSFLNLCVKNYMFDDSWIDTIYGTAWQIRYMQTAFDLAEVYARKLRKALYENGHATDKFVRTTMKSLLAECKTEFKRFKLETIHGKNTVVLEKWKSNISADLNILAEYESEGRNTPKYGAP